MTEPRKSDTRRLLLEAAADLIAASPGQDVPLRAICDRVGVKLPTLYHFFGSKEGLLDAVVDHGFDLYLGLKTSHESVGDPIADISEGWDTHVAFGVTNPAFYALMYGQVTPGRQPAAQQRATDILLGLTRRAAEAQQLAVPAEQAAAHVLAANVGVTLRQIVTGQPDPELSAAVREATLVAITGLSGPRSHRADAAAALLSVLDVGTDTDLLAEPERDLLAFWLRRLTES